MFCFVLFSTWLKDYRFEQISSCIWSISVAVISPSNVVQIFLSLELFLYNTEGIMIFTHNGVEWYERPYSLGYYTSYSLEMILRKSIDILEKCKRKTRVKLMSLGPVLLHTYAFPSQNRLQAHYLSKLRLSTSEFKRLQNTRFGIRISSLLSNTLPFDFHSRLFCVGMLERKPWHWDIQAVSWDLSWDPYHRKQTGTMALRHSLPCWAEDRTHSGGTMSRISLNCLKFSFEMSPTLRDWGRVTSAIREL